MKKQKGYALAVVLIYAFVVIAGLVGWVMNIVDVVNSDFDPITGMLVVRIVGIFIPPLGAVLGYF